MNISPFSRFRRWDDEEFRPSSLYIGDIFDKIVTKSLYEHFAFFSLSTLGRRGVSLVVAIYWRHFRQDSYKFIGGPLHLFLAAHVETTMCIINSRYILATFSTR